MDPVQHQIARALSWLDGSVPERHYQATMLLRIAAERQQVEPSTQAVPALCGMLKYGSEHAITLVAVEALACLVALDAAFRVGLHGNGTLEQLVAFVRTAPDGEVSHRCLLVFQVLSDTDADRRELLQAGALKALIPFFTMSVPLEVMDHVVSTVCNLCAGAGDIKTEICDAGLLPPLLKLLSTCDDSQVAQLAALSIRNLSSNQACQEEIRRLQGLPVLLHFFCDGLQNLQYTLFCEATYRMPAAARSTRGRGKASERREVSTPSLMAVDVHRGQLLLTPRERPRPCCLKPQKTSTENLHKSRLVERYILMQRAVRFVLHSPETLEMQFDVDGRGVPVASGLPAPERLQAQAATRELMRVCIDECDAQELSELMAKLLNKLYTERDFGLKGGENGATVLWTASAE